MSDKKKKIKITDYSYYGKIEMDMGANEPIERKFISSGSWMIDVTHCMDRLPDDVQLAFQFMRDWQKMGKEATFTESEFKEDIDKKQQIQYESRTWSKLLYEQVTPTYQVEPTSLSYGDYTAMRINGTVLTQFCFLHSSDLHFIHKVFDRHVRFYSSDMDGKVLMVKDGEVTVGLVSTNDAIFDYLYQEDLQIAAGAKAKVVKSKAK